ncbi:DUF2156 domain-containing protein [Spirochaeta isovalerica]|uniref:Phosphatidylglycerol lysyltransferase C-terminal domain-containing protein n=1 Tax=Spirochaeta isovalerica TaxID=150 RepID=A0A841RG72_9SPIO|nr:phosphatidylglycerol lysyltransferase domain-containing protein [Spirochaeta isovalerica]MBB6482391.1 hypothetical protein [Spirochaeta isovalerica]
MTATKLHVHTSPLGLNNRELLISKLKDADTALSEYCFANLYLFRDKHDYQIVDSDGYTYLSGLSYNGEHYIMPLENLEKCSENYIESLKNLVRSESYQCIFPIPEKWLRFFPENDYRIEYIEDDSEYIYQKEKLADYPGRKLSKKRNLVSQFLREHDPEIRKIDKDSMKDILSLLQLWQCRSGQEMGDSDYNACIDGLKLYNELGLSGALFLADGEPSGFVMGEYAGESSYVIHFAKGNIEKKGIYQYMFQAYVREFCDEARIINLEQDMGMEGLRKTKRSYQPDRMLHKYRIYPKV